MLPKVFAHYYIWWTPDAWTKDIGITDMPSLGYYNSGDDSIIEEHMNMAKSHGIDGWFISYPGDDAWNRDRLEKVVAKAREKDFKLGITTEWMRYGQEPYPPETVELMKEEIRYLIDKYGNDPVFTWTPDGRMPIFVYNTFAVGGAVSTDVISTIRAEGRDALFLVDGIPTHLNYDWWFNTAGYDGILYYTASLSRWDGVWEQHKENIRSHPGKLWGLPAAPGFDNTHGGAGWSVDRENGGYYRAFLDRVLPLEPDFICINSFNEWYENSQIEPGTGDHMGTDPYLYMRITKEYFATPIPPILTIPMVVTGASIGAGAGYAVAGEVGAVIGTTIGSTLGYVVSRYVPPTLETTCVNCGGKFMFTTHEEPTWCPYCSKEQIVKRRG